MYVCFGSERLDDERRIVDPRHVHIQRQHSGHTEPVFAAHSAAEEPERHIVPPGPRLGIGNALGGITRDHVARPTFDNPLLAFALA